MSIGSWASRVRAGAHIDGVARPAGRHGLDVPVVACGVRVAPGGLIAADSSRVVVVPQAQAERVVTEAEQIRDAEAREFERQASNANHPGE